MGPTVKIPDISLQPITDVQPLTSKNELTPPVEQERMGRCTDVLGNQKGIIPSSFLEPWDPPRCLVFQPLTPLGVEFTSSDLKSSLIALNCIIGTGKRRSIRTGSQSHTGWAVEAWCHTGS